MVFFIYIIYTIPTMYKITYVMKVALFAKIYHVTIVYKHRQLASIVRLIIREMMIKNI